MMTSLPSLTSRLGALSAAAAIALAAALAPVGAMAQSGSINLNDLGSGGVSVGDSTAGSPAPTTDSAALPTVDEGRALAAGGAAAAGEWLWINNVGVNSIYRYSTEDGEGFPAQIEVLPQDISWSPGSGKARVRSPVGTGKPAGEGYLFPDAPAHAILLWLEKAKTVHVLAATDDKTPLLIDMQGEQSFLLVVNDGEPGKKLIEAFIDNYGAYDILFRRHVPQ